MTAAWDEWGQWLHDPDPEPDRETVTGTCYCIDWTRRRLTPVVLTGSCLHGELMVLWCGECEADLDALATDLLPNAPLPRDPCPECGGDGEVLIEFAFGMQMQDCGECFGSGTVDD